MKRSVFAYTLLLLIVASFLRDASAFQRSMNENGKPLYWESSHVEMSINANSIASGSIEDLRLREAIAEWNRFSFRGSRFYFTVTTGTASHVNLSDKVSAVGWAEDLYFITHNLPAAAAAVTWTSYHSGGDLISADIVFRRSFTWDYDSDYPCSNGLNFKQVAIHELGHALGLDHEVDVPCIMGPAAVRQFLGENHDVTPMADDLAGNRAIYWLPALGMVDLAAGVHPGFESPTGSTLQTGESSSMSYAVHNLSSFADPVVDVSFYLSKDRNIGSSDDTRLVTISIKINSGSVASGRTPITIPERLQPGTYYLGYIVDPNNALQETNESNNKSDFCSAVSIIQGPRVYVNLGTSPSKLSYMVDGKSYSEPREFVWDRSSAHTLSVDQVQNEVNGSRYNFRRWSNTTSTGSTIYVNSPSNSSYAAVYDLQHYLTIESQGGGTVSPNSGWFGHRATISLIAASNSIPFSEWVGKGDNSYSGCFNPISVTMNAPIVERAIFDHNPNSVEVSFTCDEKNALIRIDRDTLAFPAHTCALVNSDLEVEILPIETHKEGVRRHLKKWQDGDTNSVRRIRIDKRPVLHSVEYKTQYLLTMESEGAGIVHPATTWCDSAATVAISAEGYCGSIFERWDGEGQGSYHGTSAATDVQIQRGPVTQIARFSGDGSPTIDVTPQAFSKSASRIFWADFDNDSDLDLLSVATNGAPSVYLNTDGSYLEYSGQTGFSNNLRRVVSASIFDINSDGNLDIYLVSEGENYLYLGNGRGGFTEETPELLRNQGYDGIDAKWMDFNRDGTLDVVLLNQNGKSRLIVRRKNGTLQDVTPASLNEPSAPKRAIWTDFDHDGYPDLFIVNNDHGNYLYRNVDGLKFMDVTHEIHANGPNQSLDACWADYDNDGFCDLLVAAKNDVHLYQNKSANELREVNLPSIRPEAIGVKWVDFNNDGYLDIYIVGDDNRNDFIQVLLGTSAGTFTSSVNSIDVDNQEIRGDRSFDFGDVDNDGDLDAFVLFPERSKGYTLRTENTCGNYFNVELKNQTGHGSVVGAWVSIQTDKGWRHKFVDQEIVNFGLQEIATIRKLVVNWPTGEEQSFDNLPANQTVRLSAPVVTGISDLDEAQLPDEYSLYQNQPNPFNPTTEISFGLPTGCKVKLSIYNILGEEVSTLIDEVRSAGTHSVTWNGKDKTGRQVASGIYLYRLTAAGYTETRKMLLLK